MAAPPLRPDRFRLDAPEPAYLALHRDGRLAERAARPAAAWRAAASAPRVEACRLEGRAGLASCPQEAGSDARVAAPALRNLSIRRKLTTDRGAHERRRRAARLGRASCLGLRPPSAAESSPTSTPPPRGWASLPTRARRGERGERRGGPGSGDAGPDHGLPPRVPEHRARCRLRRSGAARSASTPATSSCSGRPAFSSQSTHAFTRSGLALYRRVTTPYGRSWRRLPPLEHARAQHPAPALSRHPRRRDLLSLLARCSSPLSSRR